MSIQLLGLVTFISVIAINVIGLLLDLHLITHGIKTITDRVYENAFLGIPILALQVIGTTGLLLHL